MKYCSSCGHPLRENARFCGNCGTPVPQTASDKPESPTEGFAPQTPSGGESPYIPQYDTPKPKRSNVWLIAVIAGLVIIAGVVIACFVLSENKEESQTADPLKDINRVEYDSAFLSGNINDSASIPAVEETVPKVEAPAAKAEPASETVTARGNIEGYPFSITGKWKGNKFSGTYKNEYNGVTMKCSGYEAEGILELTLTSGKTTCRFEFDDPGNGRFEGTFYPGNKSAELYMS